MYDEIIRKLNEIIDDINRDSYYLTRTDQSAVEWRLNEIKNFIKELYVKRGKCGI